MCSGGYFDAFALQFINPVGRSGMPVGICIANQLIGIFSKIDGIICGASPNTANLFTDF